jgi:hypothetical protein
MMMGNLPDNLRISCHSHPPIHCQGDQAVGSSYTGACYVLHLVLQWGVRRCLQMSFQMRSTLSIAVGTVMI